LSRQLKLINSSLISLPCCATEIFLFELIKKNVDSLIGLTNALLKEPNFSANTGNARLPQIYHIHFRG